MASIQNNRDHVVNRLRDLVRIATRGWIEALPERVTLEHDLFSIRRQKLLIHALDKEADEIVRGYYPPATTATTGD